MWQALRNELHPRGLEIVTIALDVDPEAKVWCLGPEAMGRALTTARAPELELPDYQGKQFRLSSLRGQKVLIVTWSSW